MNHNLERQPYVRADHNVLVDQEYAADHASSDRYGSPADLRRALTGGRFWLAVLAMSSVLLLGCLPQILTAVRSSTLSRGFHAQTIIEATNSDWLRLVLPVLCPLPYAAVYVDELRTRYQRLILSRTSIGAYIRGKIIATAVSGGLSVLLGSMLAYCLLSQAFLPIEGSSSTQSPESQAYPFVGVLQRSGLLACSGVFWALVGQSAGAVSRSKSVAQAALFLFFYLLIVLCERFFPNIYVFNPKEWLSPGASWPLGAWGVFILLTGCAAIVALIFAAVVQRRISHG